MEGEGFYLVKVRHKIKIEDKDNNYSVDIPKGVIGEVVKDQWDEKNADDTVLVTIRNNMLNDISLWLLAIDVELLDETRDYDSRQHSRRLDTAAKM